MAHSKQARPIVAFDDRLFGWLSLTKLDFALVVIVAGWLLFVLADTISATQSIAPLVLLKAVHNQLGRFALFLAVGMFLLALYIGLVRRADVTAYFRRGTYFMVATMVLQGLIGALLYFGIGLRPKEDAHLIYGIGTILALPFFIYVETTAPKRPAMGSYMWGFGLLAGILIRCIQTGPWQ
jgi:hypothetical protein